MWFNQKRNSLNGTQSEDRRLVERDSLERPGHESEKSIHRTAD